MLGLQVMTDLKNGKYLSYNKLLKVFNDRLLFRNNIQTFEADMFWCMGALQNGYLYKFVSFLMQFSPLVRMN